MTAPRLNNNKVCAFGVSNGVFRREICKSPASKGIPKIPPILKILILARTALSLTPYRGRLASWEREHPARKAALARDAPILAFPRKGLAGVGFDFRHSREGGNPDG